MLLGSNPPRLQGLNESLEKIGSLPWGHTCPDLLWQPSKAGRIGNAGGVTDCRRSRKWSCRGRLVLGFKPRRPGHTREDHVTLVEKGKDYVVLGEKRENHTALVE